MAQFHLRIPDDLLSFYRQRANRRKASLNRTLVDALSSQLLRLVRGSGKKPMNYLRVAETKHQLYFSSFWGEMLSADLFVAEDRTAIQIRFRLDNLGAYKVFHHTRSTRLSAIVNCKGFIKSVGLQAGPYEGIVVGNTITFDLRSDANEPV